MFFVYPYLMSILNIKSEKPFKAKLKNRFDKKKDFTRFLKGKLTATHNGNLQIEILKGQESFKIKSFVKTFFISPYSNTTLSILFSFALFIAEITASFTLSTPTTFLEFFATN